MEIVKKKRAVIYCRVSTKEQVEEGNSLASQEKHCKEYVLKNGFEIVEKFIEQGESAKTQKRPELQRLLKYCADKKRNRVDAVIAYKIDRISRNTDDYSQIRVLLKKYGVDIISTSERFEDTPVGRFMHNIVANVSQFDNDVRAERCAGGMKDAMKEGRYVWSAPFGYSNVRIGGKATIAPDGNAVIAKKTFEEIAKNQCPSEEIRKKMAKEGLVNSKGKPYCRSQFYRMLCNEVYVGWIIKFGERHKGLFEPIISEELFEQVQCVLRRRKHKSLMYQKENPDFPLRRFVSHPSGEKITGHWSQGRNRKYPYYRFLGINGSQIRKEALEEAYRAFISEYTVDPMYIEYLRKAMDVQFGIASQNGAKEAARLKADIAELKEKQSALVDKNLEGVISNAILQQQLDLIEGKLLAANTALLALPDKMEDVNKLFQFGDKYLSDPADVWVNSSFNRRVKLQWCEFPQGVVFDGKKFRTAEVASIFKVKSDILPHLSHRVDFAHKSSNQSNEPISKILTTALQELKNLASIMEEVDE